MIPRVPLVDLYSWRNHKPLWALRAFWVFCFWCCCWVSTYFPAFPVRSWNKPMIGNKRVLTFHAFIPILYVYNVYIYMNDRSQYSCILCVTYTTFQLSLSLSLWWYSTLFTQTTNPQTTNKTDSHTKDHSFAKLTAGCTRLTVECT